MSISSIVEVNM